VPSVTRAPARRADTIAPQPPATRIAGGTFAAIAAATLAWYAALGFGFTTWESPLVWFTKPFVMPALLVWLALRVRGSALDQIRKSAVYAALVFSTLGDVFLIPEGETWYLLGVASFGLAHAAYVVAFFRREHLVALRQPETIAGIAALLVFAYILRGLLGLTVPSDELPTIDAYMTLILAMTATAALRFGARGDRPSAAILAGAALFLESDGLIALRAEGYELGFIDLAVMVAYIGGQAMIARGIARSTLSSAG
jgi:uncharacterized membrane protein YhhN